MFPASAWPHDSRGTTNVVQRGEDSLSSLGGSGMLSMTDLVLGRKAIQAERSKR